MTFFEILPFISSGLAVGLGALAVVRRTRGLIQWAFLIGMMLLALESFAHGMSLRSILPSQIMAWQLARLAALTLIPGTWLLFSLAYSRGNYRRFIRTWLAVLGVAWGAPLVLIGVFRSQLILGVSEGAHVYQWILQLGWSGSALQLVHLLCCVLILMNLERTYRASVGTMRWRIKYMVLGLGLLFGVRFYTTSHTLLYSSVHSSLIEMDCIALLLGSVLIVRSLLREGLFNQDVYPSQSVLQYSLTGLLAGIYLLVVGVLAKIIASFGGDLAYPLQAFLVLLAVIVFATLLLSDKIRQFIKGFVSRHFRRPSYDYRLIWTTFTKRTASLHDQELFCREVVKWMSENFQALSATIWLMDDSRQSLAFGASTSIEETKIQPFPAFHEGLKQLLEALIKKPTPFAVNDADRGWAGVLMRHNPNFFKAVTNRMFVPIVSGEQLLGLMALGDRVNNQPYSVEDVDLLQCLGDQIAAHLLNIRLGGKLVEGKELEAFQAMSAFFVHDLKNTASTLSLMLENMPRHFEDPEFRDDALRGLAKSVDRINDLIGRLSMLRQELGLKRAPADPNAIVQTALREIGPWPEVKVEQALQPVPQLSVDAEQIRKVLTNFLVNAAQAVKPGGTVRVETTTRDGQVMIGIADDGCGMTPDFVSKSLFRPFQTTKKKGIGIGLFLSKRIVEAHGGSIEVESELGKGTCFRLLLPAQELKT